LFLGFWSKPRPKSNAQKDFGFKTLYRSEDPKPGMEWFSDLKETLVNKKTTPNLSGTTSTVPEPPKKFVLVSLFIFSIFFIIIISVIFSESDIDDSDALIYFQQGEQFRWDQQYDSAEYYYQKALVVDPEFEDALNGYGGVLIARNNYDSAISTFDRVLEINPDNDKAKFNKALVFQYQKNFKASLIEAFQLLKTNPEYNEALVLAGDDYYFDQRYDSAIYWYEEGYAKGQRSGWLCHVMGYLYDTKGNLEKAVPLYKEALSYDSQRVQVYERLGELFPGEEGKVYRTTANKLKQEGY
jgi:tetratricopeptide (TPR) repeat protein